MENGKFTTIKFLMSQPWILDNVLQSPSYSTTTNRAQFNNLIYSIVKKSSSLTKHCTHIRTK